MIAASTPHEMVVDYFLKGCTPRRSHRIGMEVEHLCIRKSDGRRIPYFGRSASVVSILKGLLDERGGRPVREGGNLVGVEADWGKVSLEPGGQIEWSSPPCGRLSELLLQLDDWLEVFRRVIDHRGVTTLDRGFDDTTALCEIPWVPKQRYAIMRRHFRSRREVAFPAMANTASVHVSIDYCDADDWRQKFRAMLLLTPIATAIFGNSPTTPGRSEGFRAVRSLAWLATDPPRCQLPASAFTGTFGLPEWARWLYGVPSMLTLRDGKIAPGPNIPFCNSRAARTRNPELWQLHLSSIFTVVRSQQRLEVRSADVQQDELLPSVPAFWHGLMYSKRSLAKVLELVSEIKDERQWQQLLMCSCRQGLEGDPWLREVAIRTVQLAIDGLCDSPDYELLGLQALENLASRICISSRDSVPWKVQADRSLELASQLS